MPHSLQPRRVLAHPLWWIALALLAANDHLFKGAGVLPGALTGKLSDFAGLLVAPALLAVLLGVNHRRGWITAHLAVGLGFAAINLSPAIARAVEAASLATPFPWIITVDPTDLIALPMLALSAVLFARWAAAPINIRPMATRLGIALGGLASVATSSPSDPPPPPEPFFDIDVDTALMLVNRTPTTAIVRIRPLAPEVALDCDAIAADPTTALAPDLFAAPEIWSLQPDRGVALPPIGRPRTPCDAFLVDGATGSRLIFIDTNRWPIQGRVSGGPDLIGDWTLPITDEGLAPHPAIFRAPTRATIDPLPACATPAVGAGLDWTPPPTTTGLVYAHTIGADGCHALDIRPDEQPLTRWYFCAPGVPLHFNPDEVITVRPAADGLTIELDRGTIELVRTATPPARYLLEARPTEGCDLHRDACDGFVQRLTVTQGARAVQTGESAQLVDGRTLYVLRAERAAVTDARCDPWGAAADRFELVVTDLTAEEAR